MLVLTGAEDLTANLNQELGVSDWHEVTQESIDQFARVTGDDQWIHVDVDRAKESPFGGTIAHGNYTLSLGPKFSYAMFSLEGFAFALNCGFDKVRLPAPLPVGSRVRMRATLSKVEPINGGVQITVTQTFEREHGDKPVCVAEMLTRAYH
ncbi:MaoC family dehydratase [Rhodococcus sp. NPDC059969]|uniref:MaoC family dehydratase n=1 Tax=Rhodococcus sp. NPDC059969 TaxID=3347018 RepID=UPI0036725FA1